METITLHKADGIATITLNRPKVFNSINQKTAFQFHAFLDDCEKDEKVRVVIITGTGRAFCAGQDLGEIIDPNGPPLADIVSQHYNPIIERIRRIEKPFIAAINGVAAGAGANIALCCDITLAKESANFIQAFSKIGLIPDSAGTFFLPRLVGFQKASALMMLGDKVGAKDAEAMGMIYKAIPDEEFETFVQKTASKLANMPTKALGLTKRLLNASNQNNLKQQLDMEGNIQIIAGTTEDYSEGVNAFIEKRKPVFKGK